MIENTTAIINVLTYPNLIATVALVVSILSIFIGFWGLWLQRNHNRLSVRPIAVADNYLGKERISISIKNAGVGPLLIKSIDIVNKKGVISAELSELLPPDEINCLIASLKGLEKHTLSIGESLPIFIYDLNFHDKEQATVRDKIQNILKDLTIRLRYTDIYGKEQEMFNDDLCNICQCVF